MKREKSKEDYLNFYSTGYVYFMKSEGHNYVKIGVSKHPPKRKIDLQTKLPFKLKILNKFKCRKPYTLEKKFHRIFREQRTNGEWFMMTNEQIELISELNLDGMTKSIIDYLNKLKVS